MPSLPAPPRFPTRSNHITTKDAWTRGIIFHTLVLFITSAAVAIRVYTRAVIKKYFGVDDYLLVLSWMLSFIFSMTLLFGTRYGLKEYVFHHKEGALNLISLSIQIYIPLTLTVKLCILTGYARIFQISPPTKYLIWAGVSISSLYYTITFIIDVFMCKPIGKARYLNLQGKCDGYMDLSQSIRIFNIISDWYILMIPIPIVLGLKGLSLAKRIRIMVLFGLGLFTCICSIILFVENSIYLNNRAKRFASEWMTYGVVLEVDVGIICACAPVFTAFFDPDTPRSFGRAMKKLFSQ